MTKDMPVIITRESAIQLKEILRDYATTMRIQESLVASLPEDLKVASDHNHELVDARIDELTLAIADADRAAKFGS